jgi:pimeloyl-ACP methyl ester carboxylesterase
VPLRLPPALRFQPDELYRVGTDDGSAIVLGRYHPRGQRKYVEPVLLGHSLGTNRFNLDFDDSYSVARALARRGFETWVLELRGHGLAGSGQGSTFDVEATHDVTAALRAVTSTGVPGVLWVGHSRGGMLAYAHLARNPTAPIRAIANLGAPVTFEASPGLKRFIAAVAPVLRLDVLPLAKASKLVVPFGLPPNPVGKYLVRAENMEPRVIRQAIAYVAADVPGGVGRQFARWICTGTFDGEDGFDYRKAMRAIRVPMLLLAGARDFLAPPPAVRAAAELVSGPVEAVTVGQASGFSEDYGHGDLVLGRRAPLEVFPRIAAFLARVATPALA